MNENLTILGMTQAIHGLARITNKIIILHALHLNFCFSLVITDMYKVLKLSQVQDDKS